MVANLQPANLMGVESQGMVLAASVDGRPVLLHPGTEVPDGSESAERAAAPQPSQTGFGTSKNSTDEPNVRRCARREPRMPSRSVA